MTPTDIESVKDALAKLGKWAAEIEEIQLSKVCAKSLAVIEDLRKDRERLDFVIQHGAVVKPHGDPAHSYSLSWCVSSSFGGDWRDTDAHADFREAIDEAMTQRGEG